MRILADRTRGTAILAMLITGVAMFFFLGLYIQDVLGYSPIKAGFAFLPSSSASSSPPGSHRLS